MEKKINLGCGPVGKDDWINIDWGILAFLHRFRRIAELLIKFNIFPKGYNVSWPKNLRLCNCKKRLPFDENSIDYIYTSHLLEHFKKFEAQKVAAECFRILKKGGALRVVVPDFEFLVKKYLEKDLEYFRKVDNLINPSVGAKTNTDSLLLSEILLDILYPRSNKIKLNVMAKLVNFFIRPHFWMYDYESLKDLLQKAGFSKICRQKFRSGRVPDLEYLDVFPELSLYVEAEK